MRIRVFLIVFVACACMHSTTVLAGGGPLGIDHQWELDQSGIWSRKVQLGLEYGTVATEAVGSLWLGNSDALGHVFWQTADASIASGIAAQLLKLGFSRSRPDQGDNPNLWFQGSGHESFPSGEVTLQAAFVTPFIIRYAGDHPSVWLLEALPLYDGIARIKSRAHWQSDVLAGWALGTASGYWAAQRATPVTVKLLPGGLSIGWAKRY